MEEYRRDRTAAFLQLLNFIVRSCGCRGPTSPPWPPWPPHGPHGPQWPPMSPRVPTETVTAAMLQEMDSAAIVQWLTERYQEVGAEGALWGRYGGAMGTSQGHGGGAHPHCFLSSFLWSQCHRVSPPLPATPSLSMSPWPQCSPSLSPTPMTSPCPPSMSPWSQCYPSLSPHPCPCGHSDCRCHPFLSPIHVPTVTVPPLPVTPPMTPPCHPPSLSLWPQCPPSLSPTPMTPPCPPSPSPSSQ